MNRAFFIIAVPLALVVIGYCVVFWRAGLTLPKGMLLVPVVVLLGAASWWVTKRGRTKKKAGA